MNGPGKKKHWTERAASVEFDERFLRGIERTGVALLAFLLLFAFLFRGQQEFWSALVGGGFAVGNFLLLEHLIRRFIVPEGDDDLESVEARKRRLATLFMLKTAGVYGGITAFIFFFGANWIWFITGLSVVVFGTFIETIRLVRRVWTDAIDDNA